MAKGSRKRKAANQPLADTETEAPPSSSSAAASSAHDEPSAATGTLTSETNTTEAAPSDHHLPRMTRSRFGTRPREVASVFTEKRTPVEPEPPSDAVELMPAALRCLERFEHAMDGLQDSLDLLNRSMDGLQDSLVLLDRQLDRILAAVSVTPLTP